ncbi:hypothetical protein EUTSA_v10022507mg, partial [Eutrema salsugineum]
MDERRGGGKRERSLPRERRFLRFPASGFSTWPVAEDIYEWQEMMMPPPLGCPYEGGHFFISIHFPAEYSFRTLRVAWKTLILHPNIDKFCIFHPLLVTATWKTKTTVKELLQAFHDICSTL